MVIVQLSCEEGSRVADEGAAGSGPLLERMQAESPFAWAGVGDMVFSRGGELSTPWGAGKWGAHKGDPSRGLFVDFVGARHNVRSLLTPWRCSLTRLAPSRPLAPRPAPHRAASREPTLALPNCAVAADAERPGHLHPMRRQQRRARALH